MDGRKEGRKEGRERDLSTREQKRATGTGTLSHYILFLFFFTFYYCGIGSLERATGVASLAFLQTSFYFSYSSFLQPLSLPFFSFHFFSFSSSESHVV